MDIVNITTALDNFPCKYKEGLTKDELNSFLNEHKLNHKVFMKLLGHITVMVENDTIIIYRHDIKNALVQLKTNSPNQLNWD
jgi:hypothetical protein